MILRDKNVDESSSWVKQPSASVRVVEPSYLQLKVVPPQGPALVTSRPAAVAASAYDANHNRIYLTEVCTHMHANMYPVHFERKWSKRYHPLYCTLSLIKIVGMIFQAQNNPLLFYGLLVNENY